MQLVTNDGKRTFAYHALLFVSFIAAVSLKEWVTKILAKKIINVVLLATLPWIIVYLLAAYAFPYLGIIILRNVN